jgi:2-polyprenyl-3-methyl-5-hydroxy-6-metoxy-1,4-benzoquinol methylase
MASMRHIVSEESTTPRYDFSFAWESSYGHVVELVKRLGLERGVVIDLGCGVGSIAQPLLDLGYEYIGMDIDPDSLEQLSKRGLEGRELDLCQTDELAERMLELAGGRRVSAVLLLDVIEHLPQTRTFLTAIREGLELLGRPPLFVSVPNVAHADLAAKLVFGKWDYTTTGLLDSTHTQFFTSERLRSEARACGLLELDAHDFKLRVSDQHFPADHPALSWTSPIAQAIRVWRESADPYGETIQFIRVFVPCDTEPAAQASEILSGTASTETSPLAVVMRTQGKRASHLRDALTCLAAQTADSFEVHLMVHSDDAEPALGEVRALVEDFEPAFASRVGVVHVSGGRRARPLNAALARLKAEYVAFLDDDDLVMADWVESFIEAAGGGAIVRSGVAVREVSAPEDSHCHSYVVQSSLQFRYKLDFDRLRHFWENETPICTFAVPRSLIEAVGLRFDEELPVLEDWDFLMRCVAFASVRDTRKVTSVYQMWRSGESSASLHEVDVWQATQRVLQDRMNLRPLVLPAGSTDRLAKMCERLAELDATRIQHEANLKATRHEAASLRNEARRDQQIVAEAAALVGEFERIRNAYHVTISSRRWRILGPPARTVAAVRRVCKDVTSRAAMLLRRK